MYKFLYKVNSSGQRIAVAKTPSIVGLPDPNVQQEPQAKNFFETANKAIVSIKKPIYRGKYNRFDAATRRAIAVRCIDCGPAKTVRHFASRDIVLNQSTVRSIRDA